MALLATRDLEVAIADVEVCRGLDLTVERGQRWAVLGRNGIGKTTLLKTLAGVHAPVQGELSLEGEPLAGFGRQVLARKIGVLFQEHGELFPGTVLETALIGRHPYIRGWRWEGEDDLARARRDLEATGLAGMEGRNVATLSGGERQRLAIATVLTQEPELYLLDEPTNHLDLHHQIAVMQTLCARAGTDNALIVVLHDVNLAARFCDHALLLYGDGESDHGPVREVLNAANLERMFEHPVMVVPSEQGDVYLPGVDDRERITGNGEQGTGNREQD